MNAKEFENTLSGLIGAISKATDFIGPLAQHRLEMAEAEEPVVDAPEYVGTKGRLDTIEKRLDEIERKAKDVKEAYIEHVTHLHKETSILGDASPYPSNPQPEPIEIEMRVTHPMGGEWGWEARLGAEWIAVPDRYHAYWTTKAGSTDAGNAWLAVLGEQLGAKLVADWGVPCPSPASG